MAVEPVPGEPAAVATVPAGRALVVADYHAGLEVGLRAEGVELPSHAGERREHLIAMLDRVEPDRLVILGDLGHDIGDPGPEEREEVDRLLTAVTDRLPTTLVKGNHDGAFEGVIEDAGVDVAITPGDGVRLGEVGFVHGHTWPAPDILEAEVVCIGHEHPMVRLEDEVGAARVERAWLRGPLEPAPFAARDEEMGAIDGELVVFPAFNDLTGGTWINVEGQEFLAPFLPAGIESAETYLLDGTRLGDFRQV